MSIKGFAYLLFACERLEARTFDWSDWSCLDIFAAFIEVEDQSTSIDDLWTFDWEKIMGRVAPVQVTMEWNPCHYLIDVFERCHIKPLYTADCWGEDEKDLVVYFDAVPNTELLNNAIISVSSSVKTIKNLKDKNRFDRILIDSASLARLQNRGLLFIGEWEAAQPYGTDYLMGKESILRDAGMKIFTRSVPSVEDSKNAHLWHSQKNTEDLSERETIMELQTQCENNLKRICMATMMCAIDNDDRLPDAKKWCEQVAIYLDPDDFVLQCPANELAIGYEMNANLGEVEMSLIMEPQRTVLFYESDSGTTNGHGAGQSLPNPSRHPDGNAFAFADGHVEVLSSGEQQNIKWTVD